MSIRFRFGRARPFSLALNILMMLSGAILAPSISHGANGYEAWVMQSSPTTSNLYGITDGASANSPASFIVVGASGTIIVGTHDQTQTYQSGYTWATVTSGTAMSLNAVTSAVFRAAGSPNLLFVAVGDGGTILTSRDGTHWTSEVSGTTQTLRGVSYSYNYDGAENTLLLAIGDAGTVCTSLDGVNWVVQSSPTTGTLRGVAGTNNFEGMNSPRFLICGDGGLLLATQDGKVFSPVSTGTTLNLLGVSSQSSYRPGDPITGGPIYFNSVSFTVVGQNGLVGVLDYSTESFSGSEKWTFSNLSSNDYRGVCASQTLDEYVETLAVGTGGEINRPSTGGRGALQLHLPAQNTLNAVTISGTAAAVGQNGTILIQGVATSGAAPRLVNLSGLGECAATPIIVGFVVNGTGNKNVLLRGVGPGLVPFGLSNAQSDPQLAFYGGTSMLLSEDDWSVGQATTDIQSAAVQVGAFPLVFGSKDAAALSSVGSGLYSLQVSGKGPPGPALAEIYDLDPSSPDLSVARFINSSLQGPTGGSNGSLTAGFVVAGDGNSGIPVLIRVVGPSLAQFGVSNVDAHPVLTLYRNQVVLASNTGWFQGGQPGAGAIIETDAKNVGAFALPEGSADAAIDVTLAPGAYTVVATTSDGSAGTVLLEIYQLFGPAY
jgi:hypothetical protein